MADNDHGQRADFNPMQDHAGIIQNPQSRRKFLRVAAVGAAGVAGVAGAAGVARATGLSPKTLLHFNGSPQDPSTPPPKPTLDGFFKHTLTTDATNCTTTYSGTNADGGTNRFVVFYIKNLPTGNYTFNVTQTIGGVTNPLLANKAVPADPTHQQWECAQKNSSIHVVLRTANTEPTCPHDDLGSVPSDLTFNSFTVSFGPGEGMTSTKDVVIYTHVDVDAGVAPLPGGLAALATSTTFTGTLGGDASLTVDVPVTLS